MAEISGIKGEARKYTGRQKIINVARQTLAGYIYTCGRYPAARKRRGDFRSQDPRPSSCRGRDTMTHSRCTLVMSHAYGGTTVGTRVSRVDNRVWTRENDGRRVRETIGRDANFAFGKMVETRDEGEMVEEEEAVVEGEGMETRRRRRFSAMRVNGESAT